MVQPFLNPSYGLQPGDALMGLVAGDGFIFANIAAHAGGGQALATLLIPAASMYNINVVATAGDSVGLPFAVPDSSIFCSIRRARVAISSQIRPPTGPTPMRLISSSALDPATPTPQRLHLRVIPCLLFSARHSGFGRRAKRWQEASPSP